MPRNGSGIYTLPGGNPVTPGDVIEAEWANTTLEDVADALTNSLSRTGAGGMLAPFRIADGSVSGPGLSYLNETNTGLYRSGAGSTWMAVLGVNVAQFSTVGLTVAAGKALTVLGNATVTGTLSVTGATTLASSLAVTGAITATGGVSGNVTGNVTAATGTSTFNDVVITGALDMTAGSSATITGLSTPTNASDAANKGYVDSVLASKLSLTGGTMSGAIAMGSSKITGLATPTADADAATKAYVDSVAQGLDVKGSCRVGTTANITLSGTQTIDGVAVIAGDRVLVKNQSSAAENGIYVVAAGSWSRAADADTWAKLVGAFTFVEEGTVNDNSGWVCTSPAGGTLGVTAVTWEQFSGAGQITAGAGMFKSGNTLNVGTASSARIVVGTDDIDLATTGVTASTYKSVTVDAYGRVTAGTNPTTLAGFGITDAYTQTQTDTLLAAKLSTTGGTMSGAIAMGTNKITGLGEPTLAQDAATKNYIDTIFGSTTTAAASAAAAAASASAASSSASSASGSASAAAASATAAAASFDSFDDRYLGAKTSDPTVDNDGNALITGALYFNSVANEMRVYNGSAWLASYIPATGYAQLAATNTFTANQILNVNTSSAALSITQAGSGNALYIEDVAADATPFVVSSTGAVGIGTTTPDNVTSAGIALVSNDGYYPQVVNRNKTNDASASYLVFDKDRAGAIVQSGDGLGNIVFRSFDGANYLQSAAIIGYSDGTPGTNDVPGRLSFLTTADGASAPTERLTIASTGALAVSSSYGTSGQVLTSAGAGAPPTWSAPPASAGTVTAVASGALSDGTKVILNSDGTVSAVTATVATSITQTGSASSNQSTTTLASGTYDPVANSVFVAWRGTNNYLYGIAGSISGNTITFGTPVTIESNSISSSDQLGIWVVYCSVQQCHAILYAPISGVPYGAIATVTISGNTVTTRQTNYWFAYYASSSFAFTYDSTQGRLFMVYYSGNDGNKYGGVGSINNSNKYVSMGGWTSVDASGYNGYANACFEPVTGNVVIAYPAASNWIYSRVITITSNTSYSMGSEVTVSNFPPNANIALGAYYTGGKIIIGLNSSSNLRVYVGTISGSSISFGTSVASGLSAGGSTGQYNVFSLPNTATFISTAQYIQQVVVSGSTPSFPNSPSYFGSPYFQNYYFNSSGQIIGTGVYSPSVNAWIGSVLSSNLTSTNFLGISNAAYTNGQTATIQTVGSTDDAQSGLTPGLKYYVTPTGALDSGATAQPYAGLALTATKLVIKG